MGTSLNSIHVFTTTAPEIAGYSFRSFSPNWFTCTDDLAEGSADKAAKTISKAVAAPVLCFHVFDSEIIWFFFFQAGKVVARYSDDGLAQNKNLYGIPALIGYPDGYKKRLSNLLACSDVDEKITMLEEYLGVCLLFLPDLPVEGPDLRRERGESAYLAYLEAEKKYTGKAAPVAIRQVAEYPGKLFWDNFGLSFTYKPHYFLFGYTPAEVSAELHNTLTPVRFVGPRLEPAEMSDFEQGRFPQAQRTKEEGLFQMNYATPCKVTFLKKCPPEYRGQTMPLPNWFYPERFLPSGKLLLEGNHRLYVADPSLKIIAKLSFKGDIADVVGNYMLTTVGDSFCGYLYEPKAKIYIYELVENRAQTPIPAQK